MNWAKNPSSGVSDGVGHKILEFGKIPVDKVNIQSRQGPPEAVTVRIEILIEQTEFWEIPD